ncbi:mechanosensitive ion channel domain-containing protein [Maridesulfovibrio hydrothermalis]|uniref:MscS Mechanosensitive ion channel n=1 Tax=Maridesulfovibrio hydrothermalis AM13 = DSM 14728 TaxID=1121451 RepID=L0R7G0_9BACT|nr:mechanosensitive ion channel domain-containing protein [Maridesulfovibrio hydrothermalis]CCO22125.1 MscS Mechanosensitive ion channel [Maridesulfovibrio hydrothermalis AM13 = DSM 14728]
MTIFMRKITILTLVAMIFIMSFSLHAKAESTSQTWTNMIEGIESDIMEQSKVINLLMEKMPSMLKTYDRRMTKAQDRLDQLKLLRGLAKRTPWSYRTVLLQLNDVDSYIKLAKADLLIEKNRLKKIKRTFSVLREIKIQENVKSSFNKALLKRTKSKFATLRAETAKFKQELDKALAKSDVLAASVQENRELTSKYYAESIKNFYFERGPSLLSSHSWIDISYSFKEWEHGYSKFYHPLFVWVNWNDFLTYMAIITIILWLLLRHGVKSLLKRPLFKKHNLALYSRGVLLISFGAAILISRHITLFTSNQITSLIWAESITLGIIICARNFLWAREDAKPATLIYTPMFTLWCLMTAGDFLHMLTIPVDCLGIIWLFLSIAGLAAMHYSRNRYTLNITRVTFKANKIILATGALVTIFGFGTQAMILTQVWFLFLVTLQVCTALKTIMITEVAPVKDFTPQESATEEENNAQKQKKEEAVRAARQHNQMVQMFYPLSVSVIIFLFIGWATAYMGGIPFARFVFRHMDVTIGGADISIKSFFYILILFFTSRLILFWLKSFVSNTEIGGRKIESSVAHTFSTIGSYIVWVVFLFSSFFLLGIPMSALTWIASGLSIGIGFGLKDIVSNFVSGLIILFGGSIKKGDTLQHKNIIGKVVDVSIRNTTIKALDNSMIIIPNSSFLKGEIVNLNYQDTRIRVAIPVTLVPGTKLKKAKKIMMKVVKKHPKILKDPAPTILFKRFGMLGLDFEIYFWVNHFEDKFPTESDIVDELDQKFQAKKIKVAFRGVKTKYKPKGDEAAQIAAQREALKEKRKRVGKCFRSAAIRKHRTFSKIEMDMPD